MIFFVGILSFLEWIYIIQGLDVYPGSTACNRTLYLDSKLHAGFLIFNNKFKLGKSFTNSSTITCNILFLSKTGYSVGVNFFPHHSNTTGTSHGGYSSHIMTVTSENANISVHNDFPVHEIISRAYLNINYEIRKLSNATGGFANQEFEILFYTFHFYINQKKECFENDTVCVNSSRCLPVSLTCTDTYDFCANGFKNCHTVTLLPRETTQRIYSVSYNGVFIFIGCSIVLLCIMCFCQSIFEYCKYRRKSSSNTSGLHTPIVERPHDRPEPEASTNNGGMMTNQVEANPDDNPDNDSHETETVQFGLPPSYSYLEQNMALEEQMEPCLSDRTSTTTSLPPSYSTVLHHEQDFHVHVY